MAKTTSTLFLLLFFILTNIYCQHDSIKIINQKSAGMLIEYGQPYYYLPEGTRYYVGLIGANFSFPLFHAKEFFNMSVDLFPHYGYVWVVEDKTYFEIGLNVRLGFNFLISKNNVISTKIGSGPHYVNVVTTKQASGFIFSDYFLITYKRRISKKIKPVLLEFEFGYRHISNAGLKEPNRSISNFILGLGIYKCF